MHVEFSLTNGQFLLLLLFVAVVCAVLGALVAQHGGGDVPLGGLLGFVLGPLGVLIAAVMSLHRRPSDGSMADQLARVSTLHDGGKLTDAEFESAKTKLLRR